MIPTRGRFAFHKSHAAQVAHRGGLPLDVGRSDVCARYWWDDEAETVTVEYEGPAKALVEIGAAIPEMLAPGRKGTRRCDADGDRFSVDRRKSAG